MWANDIFARLPSATALLVASSLLGRASSHALPRATVTVEYRIIDAVAWPPLPTPAPPFSPAELNELRRRQNLNTVCGFIGGDAALPATCLAGSHCVLDQEHGAVGCCPDGDGPCTTGVFTGCVDFNSAPQTVVNPYVFTCGGSDVCYKNVYAGGYSQFGCGTASDLATTVATSAVGLTASLPLSSLSVQFTAEPSTLTAPTSIDPSTGTRPFTRRPTRTPTRSFESTSFTRSSSTPSTSSTSSTSSTLSTLSGTLTAAATTTPPAIQTEAPPVPASSSVDRTGAIIGGTISGVAILIALIAAGIYLWRRKRGNSRQGPGQPQASQYISHPAAGGPQYTQFQQYSSQYGQDNGAPYGTTSEATAVPQKLNPAYAYPAAGAAVGAAAGGAAAYGASRHVGRGGGAAQAPDEVPLTREIDDFSRGFNDALERIGEEDPRHADDVNGNGMNGNGNGNGSGNGSGYNSGAEGNGEGPSTPRPLWQQNRRQSRNLMWQ